VLSSVSTTYFDILATKERLKVARDNVANAESFMNSIRARFKQGIGTALDVAQQENVVATQRATVPPLEQHLQQDIDALAILLGKMPEGVEAPDDNMADLAVPIVASGMPSDLLTRRPDVRNAEAQLESAHADIITARAAFFPSISLTADGGYASGALSTLFKPGSLLWSVGSSAAQPIFEGGRLMGGLELRKARYDELLQNYHKAVVSAFSDVEDALAGVQQTAAEEVAQGYAEETALHAYQLSQKQLEGGIVDITTVLNVQRTLFAAQDALVQAKLQHLQAVVGLYKALGGGWKS
jgi:NodT family efflux transporter outer membrane factor (OMF) lipoprotein